jgi:hypothetical protein
VILRCGTCFSLTIKKNCLINLNIANLSTTKEYLPIGYPANDLSSFRCNLERLCVECEILPPEAHPINDIFLQSYLTVAKKLPPKAHMKISYYFTTLSYCVQKMYFSLQKKTNTLLHN